MNPQISVIIDLPKDFTTQVAKKMIELQGTKQEVKIVESHYSVKEVSKILELNPKTVIAHIKADLLTASKPGKSYIISENNLNKYLKING